MFIILIIIEIIYGHIKKKQTHNFMDTLSSLSSGMTNILKDILGLVIVIISYPYLLAKLSVYNMENTVLVYIVAFICLDFSGYWTHRLNHKINLFWNQQFDVNVNDIKLVKTSRKGQLGANIRPT